MKKLRALLLVILVSLMLPGMAMAANIVDSKYSFSIGAGETLRPDYPDLAERIGKGLTMDDFDVVYASDEFGNTRNFEPDGTYTVSEGIVTPSTHAFYMIYTPKVQGVGTKTVFKGTVKVYKPLTAASAYPKEVVLSTDETVSVHYSHQMDTAPDFTITDYDADIIDVQTRKYSSTTFYLDITPKAVGETVIVVKAYNGLITRIPVRVAEPPSKLDITPKEFTCYQGDTIPLAFDMGGGDMYREPRINISRNGYYASSSDCLDNWREFYAYEGGEYKVTMTTYNGHVGTFTAHVYSRENCVSMKVSSDRITVGDSYVYLYAYDADGNIVYPKKTITQGSEIASISGDLLKTTGAGTVTITATNPDGSTVDLTVEVYDVPTAIYLNADRLTLEIGESFDFEVNFDKGSADYRFDVSSNTFNPEYGLYPLRREGQRVIAQAPGSATVSATWNGLIVDCIVTVPDSDKAIGFDRPTGAFGVNHTYQLRVVDRTGKVYPATFYKELSDSASSVYLTEDGLMTGAREGTTRVYAKTEDGRTLYFHQEVLQIPSWIAHADLTFRENDTLAYLGSTQSDVGYLDMDEVIVEIADESIATLGVSVFQFHKVGTTEVTLTAVNGGAQTTFLLTVLPADDQLYVVENGKRYSDHQYTIEVAYGYSKSLPTVTDYYGNQVTVTWKKTDESIHYGNPNSTAFSLGYNGIRATWVAGSCELTGTARDGRVIRIHARAFRLASAIQFREDTYTVYVGEHVQTEVSPVDLTSGDRTGELTWKVGNDSIIAFDPKYPSTGMPTVTGLKPGTTTLTATMISGKRASCTITVIERPRNPGDVKGDGGIYLDDVQALLRHCSGENITINERNADVNADGKADIRDALIIMQYIAGWNVTLK